MTALYIPLHGRDGSIRAHALVDPEDYWKLTERRWSYDASTGYAVSNEPGKYRNVRMHREIMGLVPGDGLEVDHANGDKLDYRRQNLRIVTRSEQMQNQRLRGGTSQFRGVSRYRDGRWRAYCHLDRKQKHLGYFETEAEAATAAAAFRREHMPYATN